MGELFGTPASIAPRSPDFIRDLSQRMHTDAPTAESIALVCQFLLTVVESGHPPREILRDVREFVSQHAVGEDADIVAVLDEKSSLLEALLTPKPERSRALKVGYLAHQLHPTAESFRSVCELRPVFECLNGLETIAGFVPAVLMTVSLSTPSGEERTVLFQMTPETLDALESVLKRTREKLAAIRSRFGNELLGD